MIIKDKYNNHLDLGDFVEVDGPVKFECEIIKFSRTLIPTYNKNEDSWGNRILVELVLMYPNGYSSTFFYNQESTKSLRLIKKGKFYFEP